jgi:hypothetical protein
VINRHKGKCIFTVPLKELWDVMPRIDISPTKIDNILERKVALSVALAVLSSYSEQNINAYGDVMSYPLFGLLCQHGNHWADFYEISYERYAIGGQPIFILFNFMH